MTNQIDTLIKDIAVKHGVAIDRDDPILILQTLNTRFMENNAAAQLDMLNQFKEEMEGIALRWGNESKEKSERILNATLAASKEAMTGLLQESATTAAMTVQNQVDKSLADVGKVWGRAEKIAMINLFASGITFLAACTLIVGLVFR